MNSDDSHSPSKPKVALVVGSLPGPPFIESLVNALADEFQVFVFGRSNEKPSYADGVRVERTPTGRWRKLFYVIRGVVRVSVRRPAMLPSLIREARRDGFNLAVNRIAACFPYFLHQPDLVHVQWAKTTGEIASLRSHFSFAILLSLRGTHISSSPLGNPALADMYRETFPSVDAFHAVCRSIGREASELGAPEGRIQVIYSGVEAEILSVEPPVLRDAMEPIRILSVGRTHWRKGYHRALTALSLLPTDRVVEYRIVGGTPDDELRYLESRIPSNVRLDYVGFLSKSEVLNEMRQGADFLLVPSVGEGIANVAIEAMAVGLPVLASDCGGMSELIEHTEVGLLCDPWSAQAMVDGIVTMADMPLEARTRMRDGARDMVSRERRLSQTVRAMSELYAATLAPNPSEDAAA